MNSNYKYPIIFTQKFKNKRIYYSYMHYIETNGKIVKDGREVGKMTNYTGCYNKLTDMYELQVEGYLTENLFELPYLTSYEIKIME